MSELTKHAISAEATSDVAYKEDADCDTVSTQGSIVKDDSGKKDLEALAHTDYESHSESTKNDNQDENEEDADLLAQARADAVGDTLYSRKFILQTLVSLSQLQGVLKQDLEDDLCKLWDMTVSPEVVDMLLENDVIELVIHAIEQADDEDVRLYEILLGLLGNMCAQEQTVKILVSSSVWVETLLKLTTCMDACMLLQLMRIYKYIMSHVKTGNEQLALDIYTCLGAFDGSARNLGLMLQQSLNEELLVTGLSAINAILASCALIYEENSNFNNKLKPFSEIFFVKELWDGVNEAFLQLVNVEPKKVTEKSESDQDDIHDENEESDSVSQQIKCDFEVIQIYLNICTILVQLPDAQESWDTLAPGIMKCMQYVLLYLQQPLQLIPLGEQQEECLDDVMHICNCLHNYYDGKVFVRLFGIWGMLNQHIINYLAENPNDFEAEDDAPQSQYIEMANQVLRVLSLTLLQAEENGEFEELRTIPIEHLKTFSLKLGALQGSVYERASARLSIIFNKRKISCVE